MNQMKCTRCRQPAFIRLPSHNAKFCDDCFDLFFQSAVGKAMKLFGLPPGTRLMVAVSGGKDSLACWDILSRLGYPTLGVHIDLGIPEYSQASIDAARAFAEPRGLDLKVVPMIDLFGHHLPELHHRTNKDTCAVCGVLKRSFINRVGVEEGLAYVATGHHLDDESARLMGNLIRHQTQYLEKFYPYLPSTHPQQAARIKPLYRVDQDEIRHYCRIRDIKPVSGASCPFSRGATSHYFQEAMAFLEDKMPGTKRDFLFTYLKDRQPPQPDDQEPNSCRRCGQPTYLELCGACRLRDQLEARLARPSRTERT